MSGDGVRPVHSPLKKGERTALPPGDPDRLFSGRFPGVAESGLMVSERVGSSERTI